jgi:hypothetical protein
VRISGSAPYGLSVCVAVAMLAGCNSGGSQLAPDSMQQSAVGSGGSVVRPLSIVYTPTSVACSVPVDRSCMFAIDVNNNGKTDFTVEESLSFHKCSGPLQYWVSGSVTVRPARVPGVVDGAVSRWAGALNTGDQIGKNQNFDPGAPTMTKFAFGNCGHYYDDGYWLNAGVHYLGLRFPIHGRAHYGWAQLSVTENNQAPKSGLTTTLTGYAYQTKAGRSIMAGQK